MTYEMASVESSPILSGSSLDPMSSPGPTEPVSTSGTLSSDGLVFMIQFSSAYAFRQLYEFFRLSVSSAALFLTRDTIRVSTGNGRKSLQILCAIEGWNTGGYQLNVALASRKEAPEPYHVINFNFTDFYSVIKTIGKKDLLIMYQHTSSPHSLILMTGQRRTNLTQHVIRLIDSDPPIFDVRDPDKIPTHMPNITIPLSEFTSFITDTGKSGAPCTIFRCYSRGVHIFNETANGGHQTSSSWGIIPEGEDAFRNVTVSVTKDIVKALGKTSNFHSEGIVRFYARSDGLIRLEIPLSVYGTVVIYLLAVSG